MSKVSQTFSVAQAAEFSGLSTAMVNYLVRERIVMPTTSARRGRGLQRHFAFGDIVVMKAVARMLAAGVSVYRMRRALAGFREVHPEITPKGMPASYLVTDGREVFLRHRSGLVELLARQQFSFAFVLEVDSMRKEAVAFASAKALLPSDKRRVRRTRTAARAR